MNIVKEGKQYIVNGFQGHYSNFNFAFSGSKVRVLYEFRPITDFIDVTRVTVNSVDVADADDLMEKVSITETSTPPLLQIVTVTTNYNLTAADNGKLLVVDDAGRVTIGYTAGLPVGFHCRVLFKAGVSLEFDTSNPSYSLRYCSNPSTGKVYALALLHLVDSSNFYLNIIET